MKFFFRNILLFFLIFFITRIEAQNEPIGKKNNFAIKNSPLATKEDNQIKALYASYNNGEEKSAYKKAHQLLKTAKLPKTISNANLLIAYYFNKQSALDSSLYYTKKALQNGSTAADSLQTRLSSLSYNLMASIYRRKGLLTESKKYRIKGMEASLKYNEQGLYFMHKHGLALIYSQERDYTKALQLFKECLVYTKDSELIYGSYINIGDIYSELKNYELSNQYFKKAALLCEKEQNNNCSAIVASSMGVNYSAQNQLEDALKSYQVALKIATAQNYQQTVLDTEIAIAKIYYQKKEYQNAKLLFSEALVNAKKLDFLQEQINIYASLEDIAIQEKNYKEAYSFAAKNEQLKDSIDRIQNKRDITELEIKFNTLQKEKTIKTLQFENETSLLRLQNQEEAIENLNLQKEITRNKNENTLLFFQNSTQKKQNEIALLKKQKQLKALEVEQEKETQNIIIITFSLLFLLIIGLLLQYYKRLKTERVLNKKQKEINSQKLENLLKEQELKLIKAAVQGQDNERQRIAQELHDSIGGNLAAIKLQVNAIGGNQNSNSMQNISAQLDETYHQVRNLSHNLIPKKFSQNQFCVVVEDYLKSINKVSDFEIETHFYPKEEINQLNENLQLEIFTIIQELLTNTIKHAEANKIDLQLNLIQNYLNLIFEDNGKGFNSVETKKGIGFYNLENRIEELSGTIEVDSKIKRGTIINIEIPIQKKKTISESNLTN